jgi:2-keto-4-pentenoate hydratase
MTHSLSSDAVPAAAITAAADRLVEAARTRRTCPPVRGLIGSDDITAAYAVQQLFNRARLDTGTRVTGRKVGLTAPAVQAQLGVDQPDLGVLFDDMEYLGGDVVPIARFLQPRVEAEVAFVLEADLIDGDLEVGQIRSAIDFAVAAIEICDSRVAEWDITFGDTVADNASAGAYVLGPQRVGLDQFEPKLVDMSMTVTGQEPSAGSGSDCLGDPLLAVQWLARQARALGEPLLAGQVILSGALGPMRSVLPGAHVSATISTLGSVSVTFSPSSASTPVKDSQQ